MALGDTIDDLMRDLATAAAVAPRNARQVVSKGALNIKQEGQANSRASSRAHARLAPPQVGYDLVTNGPMTHADIGYAKSGQGNLGAILEWGNGRARNAPHRDVGRAADNEEPRFLQAAAQIARLW